MLSGFITYLIIGVVCNFIFDQLVSFNGAEEFRFTTFERIVMTCIWPVGVGMFVFHFLRNLTK